MITKNIFKYMAACLVGIATATALTGCSSEEDPFFTASEDDMPRILNTDIPEGTNGQPASLPSIERTANFALEVIVTPVHYTTVTWFIDNVQVAEGTSVNVPVLAGDHTVKIVATTTKGLSTSRTLKLNVRPAATDPNPGNDIHERLVKQGSNAQLHGVNMSVVTKVIIGSQTVDATYDAANDCVTYTVPTLPDGTYDLRLADATGFVYGAGQIELNENPEYPVPTETTLLEGQFVIDWDASICHLGADVLADIPVGSTLKIYYEVPEAEYHNLRVVTNWWNDVPGGAQIDITSDTPNPFLLQFTEEFKEMVTTQEGMSCVGFGYTVTSITYE